MNSFITALIALLMVLLPRLSTAAESSAAAMPRTAADVEKIIDRHEQSVDVRHSVMMLGGAVTLSGLEMLTAGLILRFHGHKWFGPGNGRKLAYMTLPMGGTFALAGMPALLLPLLKLRQRDQDIAALKREFADRQAEESRNGTNSLDDAERLEWYQARRRLGIAHVGLGGFLISISSGLVAGGAAVIHSGLDLLYVGGLVSFLGATMVAISVPVTAWGVFFIAIGSHRIRRAEAKIESITQSSFSGGAIRFSGVFPVFDGQTAGLVTGFTF